MFASPRTQSAPVHARKREKVGSIGEKCDTPFTRPHMAKTPVLEVVVGAEHTTVALPSHIGVSIKEQPAIAAILNWMWLGVPHPIGCVQLWCILEGISWDFMGFQAVWDPQMSSHAAMLISWTFLVWEEFGWMTLRKFQRLHAQKFGQTYSNYPTIR